MSPLFLRTVNRFGRASRRFIVTGRLRASPGPIIERFFGGKDCFFVQVGANDGVRNDPLCKLIKVNPQWRGIFIEPLDEAFDKLRANYNGQDRFAFEAIAISTSNEPRPFYYVSRETIARTGLPDKMQGVSSLSRDHVLMHLASAQPYFGLTGDLQDYVSQKLVPCEMLMSVLARRNIQHVDIFVIDAETHDYHILKQIDLRRLRPKLILYEHATLGDDAAAARRFLSSNGYRLINCGALDTMAVAR